jgi:acyl-CoA dehydrogenase
MELVLSIILLAALLTLWYRGAPFLYLSVLAVLNIGVWFAPPLWFWAVYLPLNALLLIPSWRKALLSDRIVSFVQAKGLMPRISDTEKTALRAGTVWIDGELFSGKPDFEWIFSQPYPKLSEEEQAYLDNEVDTICAMTDDDRVFKERDLSAEVWGYLKEKRFFGMIIPEKYGGLGFSALGHSAVVQKLATRSQVLAITAMVPNSIGPAELILKYGTDEQKEHYLPSLADGREIPCFALTEPMAGSDATSIRSHGTLFKDEEGRMSISLEFEKRYITLGAVATVIGLAFVLKDPDNILGRGEELGITFALVPSSAEGVVQGRRHDPLGVPFVNSPISGSGVVIGIDAIVGGEAGIGEGWKMLMESLSVGRGISLPSTGSGGIKLTARVAGAYTMIREQFGIPVARFEGIRYELARIAAYAYMMDAARIFTIGAIDNGEKPAVINAVMKYHATEKFREVINSGMDVLGGAGIILGKRNLLGNAYMGAPIAITVEGANIMTRTLIQFGQGVIRCHPYAYAEIEALESGDAVAFDENFWRHVGFTLRNGMRTTLLGLSRGYLHIPRSGGVAAKYERRLAWSSATFAFLTDLVLAFYGGGFKQKEMLSARFGDVLSWMYLLIAAIRRYEAEGQSDEDKAYLQWIGDYAFYEIQTAYEAIFYNLGSGPIRWLFAGPLRWCVRLNPMGKMPSDRVYRRVSDKITVPGEARDRLTEGVYLPQDEGEQLRKIEEALSMLYALHEPKMKIKKALREGVLQKKEKSALYLAAMEKGVVNNKEYARLSEAEEFAEEVIQVDAYSISDYLERKP